MIDILSENGAEKYGIKEYTIDTPSELSNLPTNIKMGSTCFVISTSEKYMLNSSGEWIKIVESESGGSGLPGSLTISVNSAGVVRAESDGNVEIHQLSSSDDADFVASNIKKNITIFGVAGSLEPASAPTISVANTGVITATVGENSSTHDLSSSDDINFMAENIKKDTTIFGVTGTYETPPPYPTIAVSNEGVITATAGDKQTTKTLSSSDDANFIANNIKENTNLFGITGTLKPLEYPEYGFIPTKFKVVNNKGYMTEGHFNGDNIPNSFFYCNGEDVGQAGYLETIRCNEENDDSIPCFTGVNSIGIRAFFNNYHLKVNTISDSVNRIGGEAFYNCKNITSLTFLGTPNVPNPLASATFSGCSNLLTIKVPWALNEIPGAPWGAPSNVAIEYNHHE